MLLFHTDNVQAFGFTPLGHKRGREQAIGFEIRVRARNKWRHFYIKVYYPRKDLRWGKGTLSFEAGSYLRNNHGKRIGVKSFLRIKAGLGGTKKGI